MRFRGFYKVFSSLFLLKMLLPLLRHGRRITRRRQTNTAYAPCRAWPIMPAFFKGMTTA
jgi:hypothetical protein